MYKKTNKLMEFGFQNLKSKNNHALFFKPFVLSFMYMKNLDLKAKIGIGVLAVFIAGLLFIILRSSNPNTDTRPRDAVIIPPKKVYSTNVYSMTEVTSHKDAKNCWTTINGNVYDVTPWIAQHPGGAQAIISLCGIDGSSAFDGQHGGQRRPEAELKSFLIGKLK